MLSVLCLWTANYSELWLGEDTTYKLPSPAFLSVAASEALLITRKATQCPEAAGQIQFSLSVEFIYINFNIRVHSFLKYITPYSLLALF